MLRFSDDGKTCSFTLFDGFKELTCFQTTRTYGDLCLGKDNPEGWETVLNRFEIEEKKLVCMEQVHGNTVGVVTPKSEEVRKSKTDALVTHAKNVYLGVNTADCVPVFIYEPTAKLIAVIHVGWRGALSTIVEKTINVLKSMDANVQRIRVAIGVHIGGCCYEVDTARAIQFKEIMDTNTAVFQIESRWYVDLGQAVRRQLLDAGILPKFIDAPIACTSCQNDIFFSYRKDVLQKSSRMLGIIGIH